MKDRSYYYHKKRSQRLLFKHKRVWYTIRNSVARVCSCLAHERCRVAKEYYGTRKYTKIRERYMSEHNIIELKPVVAMKELQDKINKKSKHNKKRIIALIATVILVVFGTCFILTHQTYSHVKVTSTTKVRGTADNQYVKFAGGYLKYGRDGISLIDGNGDESWNQPYQMQNPTITISGKAAAVADKEGNSIVVLNEDGLKGEMETLLPIEKISVSDEGVVAVLMKDETAPTVVCYDATGNVLVEHKASVSSTGYPLDAAISKDGLTMMVSYLYADGTGYKGKVIYYNFGEEGKSKTDNIVSEKEVDSSIIPAVYFVNKKTSIAIGDSSFVVNKDVGSDSAWKVYKLDKSVASTFHTQNHIGFLLQNSGAEGYELRVYNLDGKIIMSENVKSQYTHIEMIGRQILMYEGERMCIYSLSGQKNFEGSVGQNIINVFPVLGINKYKVISTDGMKVVRLVR